MNKITHLSLCAILLGLVLPASIVRSESERQAEAPQFTRGVELGKQQMLWIRAAEHRMYLSIWESDRREELKKHIVENMWLSIIDIQRFIENEDAPEEERVAATRILKDLVLYFYTNPKEIDIPEGTNLSSQFSKRIVKEVADREEGQEVQVIVEDLAERSEPMVKQLERTLDANLSEYYKRDIRTQQLVDKLIEERFFPGESIEGAGIILKVPSTTSDASSSADSISFDSDELIVSYDVGANLVINDISYGQLNENDILDLRKPGYLFINDTTHTLQNKEHNQTGDDNSE
jgi:hypothetical protein